MFPIAALARPPRTPRGVAGLVVGLFLLELAAGVVPARAEPAGATEVSLHDDDGGSALFSSRGMLPGQVDRACVAVGVTGSTDPADEVRLSAEVSKDDLAPYLMVTVERGSVGRFGNCGSFAGDELWRGRLADFPATAASGIVTGWRPGLVDRATYRFTVTVLDDSRAQQKEAAAVFVWTLDEAGADSAPVPTPTPTPTPAPTPTPTPAPTPQPTPEPTPQPTQAPPAAPAPAAPESSEPRTTSEAPRSAPALPSPPADGPPSDEGDVLEAPPIPAGPSSIEEVAVQVAETALSVVRDGHFPAALIVVVIAFLALQGAVDRRDPKLAMARLHQDLRVFRQFPEPPRTES